MQLMVAKKKIVVDDVTIPAGGKFTTTDPRSYEINGLAYKYIPESFKTMKTKDLPVIKRKRGRPRKNENINDSKDVQ